MLNWAIYIDDLEDRTQDLLAAGHSLADSEHAELLMNECVSSLRAHARTSGLAYLPLEIFSKTGVLLPSMPFIKEPYEVSIYQLRGGTKSGGRKSYSTAVLRPERNLLEDIAGSQMASINKKLEATIELVAKYREILNHPDIKQIMENKDIVIPQASCTPVENEGESESNED